MAASVERILVPAGAVCQLALEPGCRLWVARGALVAEGPPRCLGLQIWWPRRELVAEDWSEWSEHGVVQLVAQAGGAEVLLWRPAPVVLSWRGLVAAYGSISAWLSQALPAAIQRRVRRRARGAAQAGSPGQ